MLTSNSLPHAGAMSHLSISTQHKLGFVIRFNECRLLPVAVALAAFFSAPTTADVQLGVGYQVVAKVAATSNVNGCSVNCWEVWTINQIGRLIVNRGNDGMIAFARSISYEEYIDYRQFMDESDRRILKQNPILYTGVVIDVSGSQGSCTATCGVALRFDMGHIVMYRNELSTIFSGSVSVGPVALDEEPPTPPANSGDNLHNGVPTCPFGSPESERRNCRHALGVIVNPNTNVPYPTWIRYGNIAGQPVEVYSQEWNPATNSMMRISIPSTPPAPFIIDKP